MWRSVIRLLKDSILTGPILAEGRAPHSSSLDLLVVTLDRIPIPRKVVAGRWATTFERATSVLARNIRLII